ncbi:uncharacterized protein HKW66_Vig0127180 [Vigna angularis]|uniref:Uncharacterized protein n=1 Tax=Phaseolus angularis TaxID=3914 RepID=A0A8T0K370_PHAAN|nr:uncharacterized protein HKW66_Vig0127180 [Vigna angularis]
MRAYSSFIADQMRSATMGYRESRCKIIKALSHKHCTSHSFSASNCRFVLMVVTVAWWLEGLVVACFVLRWRRRLGFHGGGIRHYTTDIRAASTPVRCLVEILPLEELFVTTFFLLLPPSIFTTFHESQPPHHCITSQLST